MALKFITIDGDDFLGDLEVLSQTAEADGQVKLKRAVQVDTDDIEQAFGTYLKAANLGELMTITVGVHSTYLARPPNDREKRVFATLQGRMDEIKRTAVHRLENDYFDEDDTAEDEKTERRKR